MRCVSFSRTGFVRAITVCAGLLTSACADLDRASLYSDQSANLHAMGHLRVDTAPSDAPFSAADLATNFHRVAFSYEFAFRNGRLVQGPIDKPLKRWQGTIRYRMFGDGVTDKDRADVVELLARLAPLTGLEFVETAGKADLVISIATRSGRRKISRMLGDRGFHSYRERYDIWRRSPNWTCGATVSARPDQPERLYFAHVFLGAEARGIMRTACLHEEIVQTLGLANDYAAARPSIFNDDQEFALMTDHDAMLLRALYDRRLRPGMSADEAMPIARQIFAEMAPVGTAVVAKSP